jgi:cytochrome c biogenesis protein CcmG/thiol:disulfide interchange protein DsbE
VSQTSPSGPKWWILGLGVVLLAPLVWVLYSGFGKDPHAVPDAMTGQVAPAFTLQTLDGETVRLEELRGFPVVLNFWSTWCQPCRIEHPVLQKGAETYGPQGVVFLGVLYGDEPAKARPFLKRYGSVYPTLIDPDGLTAVDYGVAGVPETYFIDKQGSIVHKAAYPIDWVELVERLEVLK